MSNTLFNFFFCDIYRIIIIIILIISLLLDLYVIKQGLKSTNEFSLIFIGMLNIMFSSFFGGFAYLLNWVDDIRTGHLLFGNEESFLCQLQSISIGYFQEVRETFLAMITCLTFLKVKNRFVTRTSVSLILLIIIGYFCPLIITFLVAGNGGYGKSHLFCFTKEEDVGKVWGIVHFSYISIDLLISFVLSISLLIHFCKIKYKYKIENDNDNFSWCNIYKKILLFPSFQIIFFSFMFTYRILDWLVYTDQKIKEDSFYQPIAGIVSIINTLPALIYTIIFSYNNKVFHMKFDKDEDDERYISQEIANIDLSSTQ